MRKLTDYSSGPERPKRERKRPWPLYRINGGPLRESGRGNFLSGSRN